MRRPLKCLSDPPHAAENMATKEKRNGEAWRALKTKISWTSGPLARNISDIQSLPNIYDLEDYHLGMLFGAILGFVGCYKLCQGRATPSIFIDIFLASAFYSLSVISSEVRHQGKHNELFTRLKFGIVVIMAVKEFKKSYEILDILRLPVFALYLGTFLLDITGMKKYARHYLILTMNLLRIKGGFQELCRILFYPGYVSPYDDRFRRK